jgi:hypothetical protein
MSGTIIYTTPYFIDVIGSLILQVWVFHQIHQP